MKGAVAAGHPVTAAAAETVLRSGGNAFDAAIAAFFTACVAEPVLASIAGGGFLLAQRHDGQARLYDFFAHTPITKTDTDALEFHPVVVDFGSTEQEFHIGLGACATPGCVRGMFAIQCDLARLPMQELVQPALDAARAGVTVTELQAYIFSLIAPIYTMETAGALLSKSAAADIATAGERLHYPDFAQVLELLSIEGEDLFYRGEIGQAIVAMCADGGGHLTAQDLRDYQVIPRQPLAIDYRNTRILTNPAPSAGGLLVGFGLRLLEETDLSGLPFLDYQHLRLLVEVMQQTSLARAEHLDGGNGDGLLDDALVRQYREQVHGRARFLRGTTHFSVVDGEGNLAAMTVSNGEGCGHVAPGTGIMLNNMLGEQDLNPQGFHRWCENQRMSSMMAPSVVQFQDGTSVATGSGGSNRIRTALLQVISNLVDFGCDLETAVHSPRIHIEDQVLNVEGGIVARVAEALAREFPDHRLFDDRNLFFGGAHSVMRRGGQFLCAGDPRRGGAGCILT